MTNETTHNEHLPSNDTAPARIGLFGGTFDPFHTGHLLIAEYLREAASLDSVLFIPALNPPHKHANQFFSAPQRYEMLCAAVASNPAFAVSDIESFQALIQRELN